MDIVCQVCGKIKHYKPSQIKQGRGRGKYCSVECRIKSTIGRISPMRGIKRPDISQRQRGENNPRWKGEKVGYMALHTRIRNTLGTPSFCEACGEEDQKKYEWANISGEYKTDLNDWIRLCTSCHAKFDNKIRNITKNYATN